jgi:hypothetical protein
MQIQQQRHSSLAAQSTWRQHTGTHTYQQQCRARPRRLLPLTRAFSSWSVVYSFSRCPAWIHSWKVFAPFHFTNCNMSSVFCDMTPCSPSKINRHFRRKISLLSAWHLLYVTLFFGLFFDPGDGGAMFLWDVSWLSTDYTV